MSISNIISKQNGISTALDLPPVIFGTSSLGNLFNSIDEEAKFAIINECVRLAKGNVVFDSAGKYGAGLALEVLGRCLKRSGVSPDAVIISNKLGWLRTELTTAEPTFEPGVWKDLKYDAVQKISYQGIMECFGQGNELLGGYRPQMVSVHDPDEYLASAKDEHDAKLRYADILEAYHALNDLKQQRQVKAIGVGAKNWKIIQRISEDVSLDWVMIANNMTIKNHPKDLMDFIHRLKKNGTTIVNSAVFHSGFLVGGSYFDYKLITDTPETASLYHWREEFFAVCAAYQITPAAACVQFALKVPGVRSVALNTTDKGRVKENLDMAHLEIPMDFWATLKAKGLITANLFDKPRTVL